MPKAPQNPIVAYALRTKQAASAAELGAVTSLDLSAARLASLDGLQAFERLEEVYLSRSLTSLEGLSAVPSLRAIRAGHGKMKDLSAVENVPALEVLDVPGAQIADLGPVAACVQLTELNVGDKIVDLSPLAALTALKKLRVKGKLRDLSSLSGLAKLTELNLHSCGLTDVSALASVTSLEKLYLFNNKIADVRPLAALRSLQWLAIGGNPIKDTSPLSFLGPDQLSLG